MKTFKYLISFLFLTLLFTLSVSAENFTFSENFSSDSIEQSDRAQSLSNHGFIIIATESESLNGFSQPDNLPTSLEDTKVKIHGLHNRSFNLSIVQDCKFQIYNYECYSKLLSREIIFPFHSFW